MQEDRVFTSHAVAYSLPGKAGRRPHPSAPFLLRRKISVWSGCRRWETLPQPQLGFADVQAVVKAMYVFWARRGMLKGPVTFLLYSTSKCSPSNTQQEHLQSWICFKKILIFFHNYFLNCASLSKPTKLNNRTLLFFRNRWRCPLHGTPVPALIGQLGGSLGCSVSSSLLCCC